MCDRARAERRLSRAPGGGATHVHRRRAGRARAAASAAIAGAAAWRDAPGGAGRSRCDLSAARDPGRRPGSGHRHRGRHRRRRRLGEGGEGRDAGRTRLRRGGARGGEQADVRAGDPRRHADRRPHQAPVLVPAPPPSRLVGRVSEMGSGNPVVGATVQVRGNGGVLDSAITDASGNWVIEGLGPGSYHVEVHARDSASASAPAEKADVDLAPAEEARVLLRVASAPKTTTTNDDGSEDVVVHGDRPPREVVKRTLTERELERIPGTNGDALKSLQNLPGVARPPLLAGFLIVRGSAPEDTSVFVDGTLVPIVYHFGGLSSVVPQRAAQQDRFCPRQLQRRVRASHRRHRRRRHSRSEPGRQGARDGAGRPHRRARGRRRAARRRVELRRRRAALLRGPVARPPSSPPPTPPSPPRPSITITRPRW